jgi:hypothetical protein
MYTCQKVCNTDNLTQTHKKYYDCILKNKKLLSIHSIKNIIAITIISILVSISHIEDETSYKNAEKINYNNNINLVNTRHSLAYLVYYKGAVW